MSTFQEAEKLLSVMTRAEKAQLLQWVVRDLWAMPFLVLTAFLASVVVNRVSSVPGFRFGT